MNPLAKSRKLSFPPGTRVRLVRCSDPYTKITPGEVGTVRVVDDMGTVHVNWDGGSSLGMVPGEDIIEVVSRPG